MEEDTGKEDDRQRPGSHQYLVSMQVNKVQMNKWQNYMCNKHIHQNSEKQWKLDKKKVMNRKHTGIDKEHTEKLESRWVILLNKINFEL